MLEAVHELGHATPEQVHAAVREVAAGVNITTVYRTLELLEELGLVTHTHLSHGSPTYHAASEDQHVHLVCRACGAVERGRPRRCSRRWPGTLERERGFLVDIGHVALFGRVRRLRGASMIDVVGAVAVEALEPGVGGRRAWPRTTATRCASSARSTTEVGLVDRSNRGVLAVPGAGAGELAAQPHHPAPDRPARRARAPSCWCSRRTGTSSSTPWSPRTATTAWLDTEPGRAGDLLTFLEKMRFLTRVEPRDATAEWAVLSLVGPRAAAALAALGVDGLAEPRVAAVPGPKFAAGSVAADPTSAVRRYAGCPAAGWPAGGGSASTCSCPGTPWRRCRRLPAPDVPAVRAVGVRGDPGGRPRTPAGSGRPTTAPSRRRSTCIAPAVHLDKGCYRGQETVARVHNLGRPPRRLVLLHLDGIATDQPPAPGTPVTTEDGRAVGFVGTAVRHSRARHGRARGGQAQRGRRRRAAGRRVGRRHRRRATESQRRPPREPGA